MRELGLVGEYFCDDLLQKNEWRIPDLARELGVIPQKIHYWVNRDGFIPAARPRGNT
jgi:Putative ATPase subunit of terminase (gpP-like)